jgi:D-alanyl-D-alanine carboxypeptidase (penicillin-binding protein 5/6)
MRPVFGLSSCAARLRTDAETVRYRLSRMRVRVAVVLVLILAGAGAFNYLRPIPAVSAASALPAKETIRGTAPALPWPARGSAALSVSGLGLIATSGNEKPVAAESIVKVMTALLILEDKPLNLNEDGPTIVVSDADVQSYQTDLAQKQSVVEVQPGELLTERQALQGLLIPSANNFAEMLARWDAGSIDAFVAKMNARALALHLTHTTFADASGASDAGVSTPIDLIALGIVAMKQDVFAQIVGMGQAELPVAGTVYNVDGALGQSGIIGIKTGSGLNLGANFLFAASVTVDGHQIVIYGCVMGQATLDRAFTAAKVLIGAMQPALHVRRILEKNETVATYVTPWGEQTDVVSAVAVDLVEWPGMVLRQRLDVRAIVVDQPLNAGTVEGSEHVVLGDYQLDVPLVTANPLFPPGRFWRLTRLSF